MRPSHSYTESVFTACQARAAGTQLKGVVKSTGNICQVLELSTQRGGGVIIPGCVKKKIGCGTQAKV